MRHLCSLTTTQVSRLRRNSRTGEILSRIRVSASAARGSGAPEVPERPGHQRSEPPMLQISRFLAALAVAGVAVAVPAVGPAAATPPVIETPQFPPVYSSPRGATNRNGTSPTSPQTPGRARDHEPAVRVPARRLRLAGRPRDARRARDAGDAGDPRRTPARLAGRPAAEPDTDVQVLPATAAVAVEASPNFTG